MYIVATACHHEAMAEARSQDWIPPALLILAAVLLGLAAWAIYAATGGDGEDETLAGQLEQYTGCLRDHGADVPVIEASRDGGLVIIVPGSLLEGDIDLETWLEAREQCRHLEPNPLDLLFSSDGFDLDTVSILGPVLDHGFGRRDREPGIREACARLEAGGFDDVDRPRGLVEMCESLGG